MTTAPIGRFVLLTGSALLGACGGDPMPPQPVTLVDVTPQSSGVIVGQTLQLTARLMDANGHEVTDRTVSWTSSAPNLAPANAPRVLQHRLEHRLQVAD